MIIDATARLQCVHQFVGYPGFLRCAMCEFRVSQLPLSKRGATVVQFPPADANGWTAVAAPRGTMRRDLSQM